MVFRGRGADVADRQSGTDGTGKTYGPIDFLYIVSLKAHPSINTRLNVSIKHDARVHVSRRNAIVVAFHIRGARACAVLIVYNVSRSNT